MAYHLAQRLGRGGTGVVDLAFDGAGRPVAVKRLALTGSAHQIDVARRRLAREADALSRLDHPAIVPLLEVVEDGDDLLLVMPHLAGGDLAARVRARGPLPPAEVHAMADRLLGALAAAHRAGVVHRDIKPANVLFDEHGRAYLADFGTASLRDTTGGLTATGTVLGTPEFMAPEQARGEEVTPAADVFALGATLRFAATGEPPYGRGDPLVVLQRAARGRLAPPPAPLDRDLWRRLRPLLRRDPARRPTAAAAAGGPAGTRALPVVRRGGRPGASPALVAVVVLALLGVGATAAWVGRGRSERTAHGEVAAPAAEQIPSAPCTDLPYQPCGAPPAPFTDGVRCLAERADYDGVAANGCEAAPDDLDGRPFDRTLRANLVPAGDIDRYPTPVPDRADLFCDGTVEVSLTAPAGTAMRLDLLAGDELVDTAVSRDGETATVAAVEPGCLTDDTATLTTRVSWVGDARSAEPYELTRSGSF
jgi:predicted Ser/Thr protein kinase